MADWRITTVRAKNARQFGQRMVNDHSKANEQLKELATAAQYSVPNAPGPEDEAIRERLDKMQGDAFDRDHIRSQVTAVMEHLEMPRPSTLAWLWRREALDVSFKLALRSADVVNLRRPNRFPLHACSDGKAPLPPLKPSC